MNGWTVTIIIFVVALLPWQVFRYARRRNDPVSKRADSKPPERDESDGFW
jgi:hypothetical protein